MIKRIVKDSYLGQYTALESFYDGIIIAGCGPYVIIYKDQREVAKVEALPYNRVFGIRKIKNENDGILFAVFGSKYVAVLLYCLNTNILQVVQRLGPFKDWIKELHFVSETKCILMFAHNFIEIYDVTLSVEKIIESDYQSVKDCECWNLQKVCQNEERCILYSARIFGSDLKNLVIVSGTVFNEILMWDFRAQNVDEGILVSNLFRSKGHEGVIFGIRIYETAENEYLLCSVSDDRTVRVWRYDKNGVENICNLFGHSARVFDAVYVFTNSSPLIVSVTEEGTLSAWNLVDGTISIKRKFASPLWCICNKSFKNSQRMVVGGNGNTLSVVELKTHSNTFSLNDQVYKCLRINSQGYLVALKNEVIVFSNPSTRYENFGLCKLDIDVSSMSNVVSTPSCDICLISDVSGNVTLISFKNTNLITLKTQTLIDVFAQKIQIFYENSRLFAAICGYTASQSFLYLYNIILEEGGYLFSLMERITFSLDSVTVHKGLLTSCMASCDLIKSGNGYFFGHGSTWGKIYVYKYDLGRLTLIDEISAHGTDCVADLKFFQNKSNNGISFITCGRDGFVNVFNVDSNEKIILNDRIRGPTKLLEKIIIARGKTFTFGKIDKFFKTYSFPSMQELESVECGPSFNKWDVDLAGQNIEFACLSQSTLITQTIDVDADVEFKDISGTVINRYHIKETKVCKFWNSWLLTGGEDTVLKVFNIIEKGLLNEKASFRKHLSSVTDICVSKKSGSEFIFSSGGVEELFAFKVNKSPSFEHEILFVSKCQRIEESLDCRLMKIVCIDRFYPGFLILAGAYSDGTIRLWAFINEKFYLVCEFSLFKRCPLTLKGLSFGEEDWIAVGTTEGKVYFVEVSHESKRFNLIVKEKGEDFLKECNPRNSAKFKKQILNPSELIWTEFKLHPSGINCINAIPFKENEEQFLMVSGGDDNSVNISIIDKKDSIQVKLIQNLVGHASSIKAMKLHLIQNQLVLLTASTDQRLNIWTSNEDQINFKLEKSIFIDLGDVSGLDSVVDENSKTITVAITGIGLQTFKIEY